MRASRSPWRSGGISRSSARKSPDSHTGPTMSIFSVVLVPPFARSALQRSTIDDAHSAADAEEFNAVVGFQFTHKWRNFVDRRGEWLRLCDLRPDMHLHPHDVDVGHPRGARVDRAELLERNAELVLM